MPGSPSISRRRFLIGAIITTGASLWAWYQHRRSTPSTHADDLIPRTYLPIVAAPDNRPRVVHVYHPQATRWDFTSGWYGDHVDQVVIDAMLRHGLLRLKDTASVSEAWPVLLPTYRPGQRIAVKVNLVNAGCDDNDNPACQPVVDVYANPHISGKTALTIGDMLFGARSLHAEPVPWRSFDQQAPNSLLFSRDPVAIDCVMCDLLRAEWGVTEAAYDYLRLAETRGLGVFERGEPWSAGYQEINYLRVDLPAP